MSIDEEHPDRRKQLSGWRLQVHTVIFGYDTPLGKLFDVTLVTAIILSVIVVMLDTVEPFSAKYGSILHALEWFFTIIFTLEYVARILVVGKPLKYIFSFYGIIDFLSIIPTLLSAVFPPAHYLADIRIVRLLRIFRILKLVRYVRAARVLRDAIRASTEKITVFLLVVLTIVVIAGTLMYIIEGEEHGFDSIPHSIYWAIVTLTTVGYGDISPGTPVGMFLASLLMIMGYGVIAVPTGIVGIELSQVTKLTMTTKTKACTSCTLETHDKDAKYCKRCGHNLS
ncbi:MAG: ion transporter [Bacteroidetes bacterium]|nr:MAG: ion transporter [Bacteroidota bacterium]